MRYQNHLAPYLSLHEYVMVSLVPRPVPFLVARRTQRAWCLHVACFSILQLCKRQKLGGAWEQGYVRWVCPSLSIWLRAHWAGHSLVKSCNHRCCGDCILFWKINLYI